MRLKLENTTEMPSFYTFLAPPKFMFFKYSEPETTKSSLLSSVCEGFSRRMFFKPSNDFILFLFTDHSEFAPPPTILLHSNNPDLIYLCLLLLCEAVNSFKFTLESPCFSYTTACHIGIIHEHLSQCESGMAFQHRT